MPNLNDAVRAFQQGQLAQAEAICRDMLAASPDLLPAQVLLCDALLQQGNADEAQRAAAAALARRPREPNLLALRGEALEALGRNDEAIRCLSEALELRLLDPRGHRTLGRLLAQRNDPTPRFSVSIITPTIGTETLRQAIDSVQQQTYPFVEHLVVADGSEYEPRVRAQIPASTRHPIRMLALPQNTGGGGFNGHRVYGAAPFLVNGMYVAFLDEDNWFEPEHVAWLMAKITAQGLAWGHALRRIVAADGTFLVNDDCESLGRWPTWTNPQGHHVDVNCYLIRRDLAITTSSIWYRRYRVEDSPDYALCRYLMAHEPRFDGSGRYTVNYRAGMTSQSVKTDYFTRGNALMHERYGDKLPWRAATE